MAKKKKAKLGPPYKVFSSNHITVIDKLAYVGHKTVTIAVALGLNEETLKAHYSVRMAKKRVEGKIALKQLQLKAAKDGNVTMLIWLGKNELGQTDKNDVTHDVSDVLAELMREISGQGAGIPINESSSG